MSSRFRVIQTQTAGLKQEAKEGSCRDGKMWHAVVSCDGQKGSLTRRVEAFEVAESLARGSNYILRLVIAGLHQSRRGKSNGHNRRGVTITSKLTR